MGVKTFAAIDVGSFELAMKIFEFSSKGGMKEIEHIRHKLDLGTDTYTTGKIGFAKMNELCEILCAFKKVMDAYRVVGYQAYGTSAVRETQNTAVILEQVERRTGIRVDILSNSEQRFLDYKSIALKGDGFQKIIADSTAIVDIGGGSMQVSLFDKDKLIATQNMRLGVLRLQERLHRLNCKPSQQEALIEEMVSSQLALFKKLYLKDRNINNIIVVDDYLSQLVHKRMLGEGDFYVDSNAYEVFMDKLRNHSQLQLAAALGLEDEEVPLLFISAVIVRQFSRLLDAKLLWAPGVTLCDGIAYEYAEKNKLIPITHDFEQDIVACALNISKRYMGSKKREETLEGIALTIFDSMKKVHCLGKRERLLLRLAALLHDCGKYISLSNLAECSYRIIISTEMIGLSHTEREIIANVVKYNHSPFTYEQRFMENQLSDRQAYLVVAKLTAILRVANGLDRSHKQKFKDIKAVLKDGQLILTVNTDADITLERGLFSEKADFFEEVFSVRPVIRQKRLG